MENKEPLVKNADSSKDIWPKIIVGGAAIFFCACMIVGAIFLSNYARPYLDTKTIVLEPDYSKISDVDRAVLEETAKILTERCNFMGCKGVKFSVSGDGQIVGKIPVYLNVDVETLARDITAIGLIEFTDFGQTSISKGTLVITDFDHPLFPKVDLINAHHTIMTNEEIKSAVVSKDQLGQYLVDFTLTESGAKIFTDYTTDHVGSYLGILLDKTILSAPQVSEPIIAGQGQISGNFDAESASNLAVYLTISPLPVPLVLVDVGE